MVETKLIYKSPVILSLGELAKGAGDCSSGSGDSSTCSGGSSAGSYCKGGSSPGSQW